MKENTYGTKRIIQYLRQQRKFFGLAVIWIVTFFILFTVMGVSVYYIWYPAVICGAIFLCYVVYDYLTFRKRYEELEQVKNHIDLTLENLPEPGTLIEEEYQMLLQEMLERKNTRIHEIKTARQETTEYVTVWTHQVKTPLTALQLLTQDLEEPERTEMNTRLFELEQYVDMMLQYLRLEGKETDYVLKEYSVRAMVNQAVRYFARIFIAKGIAVQIDIPEEMHVVTDEKWMVFVLKQIISNALKYTSEGSITVKMDHAGNLVIEDTGIGIAPEDLPRIFERGYTGYNGRKDKKATGLGLFLVHRIVKELNHEVRITSEVGVGTKVMIAWNGNGSGSKKIGAM